MLEGSPVKNTTQVFEVQPIVAEAGETRHHPPFFAYPSDQLFKVIAANALEVQTHSDSARIEGAKSDSQTSTEGQKNKPKH